MKRVVLLLSALSVLSLILGACGGSGPTATQAPLTQAPVTEAPATEPATAAPTEPPTIVAVDLAGPAMEVGSKYIYVDGEVIVAVPGSPFKAGYSFADNPDRTLTLDDFWIYNSEVTNQQYSLCVAAGKCTPPDPVDNPNFSNYRFVNFPVVGVDWQQSADYCSFVHARLPGEWEWEKAARGPDGNIFPWGNQSPSCDLDLLNYNFCEGSASDIQSFPDGVSFYGLFDMAGNVNEWVADWYDSGFPLVSPELGDKRSVRSSSYDVGADFAISAHRSSLKPDSHLPNLGFRCVVEDPTFFAPLCEQLAFIGTGPTGAEAECQPDIHCNDVGVSISPLTCTQGDPSAFTNVNYSWDPAPYDGKTITIDSNCTGGPMQYTCESTKVPAGSMATIVGQCYDLKQCDPVCGPHYMLVGDTCKWDGTGTIGRECIAGTTYDPVNQCCAATLGSGVDYTVCPAGQHKFGGICVADSSPPVDSESKPITYDSCEPHGGDGPCDPAVDPTCTCSPSNPVTCTGGKIPSPDGCSCRCPVGSTSCH